MHEPPPEGMHYQCRRCTACCRWPGDVVVTRQEVEEIAAYLELETGEFIERHTRLRTDRQGLSLKENPDHSCSFLDGRDCRIQPVKPAQCRGFPNAWNFPGWRQICEAELLPQPPEKTQVSPRNTACQSAPQSGPSVPP